MQSQNHAKMFLSIPGQYAKPDSPIVRWLSNVQSDPDPIPDDMLQLDSEILPSIYASDHESTESETAGATELRLSRADKFKEYEFDSYPIEMESRGSFMRDSVDGLFNEDLKLCESLLNEIQSPIFDDKVFKQFIDRLDNSSEPGIMSEINSLLIPLAEVLFLLGDDDVGHLTDGFHDPWIKAIPFYGPRPQPDRTTGFSWSAFSILQRDRLDIDSQLLSSYAVRRDNYFPFLTAEFKTGEGGLELADRANLNNMTIALMGVVELFRQVGIPMQIHRRVLSFSISHDDERVRIYAHYPEINGAETSFYRHPITQFTFHDDASRWACYQFTCNVYKIFAPEYLSFLSEAIDLLPAPID